MWLSLGMSAAALLAIGFVYRYVEDKLAAKKFYPHAPKQLLIKFKEGTTADEMHTLHKKAKCNVAETYEDLGWYRLESRKKMQRMLKHYKDHVLIEHAEPNYYLQASFTPNDPFFPYQYNLQKINAPAAWDISQSNTSVKIAIIDTGVQLNHPELAGKLLPGYDYVDYDNIPEDGNGHGTHVAGIAASITNNGVGIAGAAPLASIVPLRVLDNNGQGTTGNVGNGLVYAANNGIQVVNLSLGGPTGEAFLQAAVQYAWDRGAVIIAAAGNDNTSYPIVPASYPNVIAVASTNPSDLKSNFSNYGSWVDMAAPGDTILSTYLGGSYAYLSGTSMAAPHVAGVAALLASRGKTNAQIRDALCFASDPVSGSGVYWTYGRLNAYQSLQVP
ncbi:MULTISPECIES: S8 family peptidase [unclassified Paenibacillus]|uniref:S8 family peptidase n=1 Tax=unclassified Paenibacillus TaxID=185978 RepID=UPI0009A8B11B|nr:MULTISPECIES: S8 family peptidase [unclassified Paenibacillus]SLJ90286.1 thermitase Serine peptidase. MEROPS family S08A [Paenibacillus sp. RU5A]SOC59043.1 thermitase Serine peptidase. MEROPS family S08A [Paenibacillus sp. RU26A]SOC68094.1 thermitase Serine peptidase. MEROPS family S08A [Paenibacillus sp. RU5M]